MSEAEVEAPESVPDATTSRRGFLAGAAGLTGVALAVTGWEPVFATGQAGLIAGTDAPITADKRGTFVSRIALLFDEDALGGFVQSAEGGQATSDVVNEKVGADHLIHKHLAGVKYEDITINCGTGMSKAFYDWVKGTYSGDLQRKSGAVVAADFNLRELLRLDFFNGLISEIGFPALDAASKDSAKMTVKFSPETTRHIPVTGSTVPSSTGINRKDKWLQSNFKLMIEGLDTSQVNKIDSFTVKQVVSFNPDSEFQNVEVVIPNLKVSLAESTGDTWWKWLFDFVVKGNNSVDFQKKGSLSYLATDLKTEFFRLDFNGLGLFRLDPDPLVAGSATVRHIKAELFVQQAKLSVGPSSAIP